MLMDDVVAVVAHLVCILHVIVFHEAIRCDTVHKVDHAWVRRTSASDSPVVAKDALKLTEQPGEVGDLKIIRAGLQMMERDLLANANFV